MFGWGKAWLAGAFAMTRVESGLLGPLQGWLTDKYGPRAILRSGILIFGLGFTLERIYSLLVSGIDSKKFFEDITNALDSGGPEAAVELCEQTKGPISAIFYAGLSRMNRGLSEVEKAIQNADMGLNPATDGDIIRIPIPALSEERRKELTKVASKAAEDTKVSIRSHRRSGIDQLSKLKDDLPADDLKRYEAQIQDLTDKFVQKIDELYKIKENELLEV